MESIRRVETAKGVCWQFELIVEADVRKVLTLEQIFTVQRRILHPDALTREDREGVEEDTLGVFQSGGGERYFRTCAGEWTREGRSVTYYLDDDVVNNEDGTITAAFLRWELGGEDAQVEEWFRQLCRAIEDAQENLLLFGRI